MLTSHVVYENANVQLGYLNIKDIRYKILAAIRLPSKRIIFESF